jgi:UDP-glucose 4-epimerase
MNKKILITGGLGYIGSHTVVELIARGYKPIIVDNLSNSNIGILDRIEQISGIRPEFHQIDLTEISFLKNMLENHPELDDVIHFAASKAVGESVLNPLKYYNNNLIGLLNLLTCFKNRSLNLVFSSSCTVYGDPDSLPVTEKNEVKKSTSPYGNTKQIAEEILAEVAQTSNNLKVISLRYFNPVGAHPSALIGELPLGTPQNLVPFITQAAIGKREKLTVFGDNYHTPDGTCIRDYIHVVDLAKAHLASLEFMKAPIQGNSYDVFNIGTGNGYSVLDVIKTFEEVSGKTLNYEIGPRRNGDTAQIWGDTSKALNTLGWKADLGLVEMMESAWKWELNIQKDPVGLNDKTKTDS